MKVSQLAMKLSTNFSSECSSIFAFIQISYIRRISSFLRRGESCQEKYSDASSASKTIKRRADIIA